MKKFFDKYVAQSSTGQMIALMVAFALLIIAGGVVGQFIVDSSNGDNAKFGRPAAWGFMQCVDGGFVDATIANNTEIVDGKITKEAPIHIILLSLGFWLGGMILVSFFTGAATDFLGSRRKDILNGDVDYDMKRGYILVIGYDFQVKNLIHRLMAESSACIVLITDRNVPQIYENVLPELQNGASRRLFVMRRELAEPESYAKLTIRGAQEIYIIGDEDSVGRDGKVLKVLDLLVEKARSERTTLGDGPIPLFLHIEDSVMYSRVRAMKLPPDECPELFNLEVYNYYESWAWRCWSEKGSVDAADQASYLPIRHRSGTKHAELFIIGAGRMGRALANFAIPLMNYGEDCKHCKITLFDVEEHKRGFLPDEEVLKALPEVGVEYRNFEGCSDEANVMMREATGRPDTSVTIVIALKNPDAAVRAALELSNRLHRSEISVLVWQSTDCKSCPDKKFLRLGGEKAVNGSVAADRMHIAYFGMTDVLPWKGSSRFDYGKTTNFFYEACCGDEKLPEELSLENQDFVARARRMYEEHVQEADRFWKKAERWEKWASVSGGDSLREKSMLFENGKYNEIGARNLLVAEHNRWWTDKLLCGWLPASEAEGLGSHAFKTEMIHGDMVPFGLLAGAVKDKDKINIAAMAVHGFIS